MLYNLLVGALAFSAPPSMTRRDALGAGALAAVVFPSAVFAEAPTKPATKDGRNNNPETVEETMARLGLKPATSESIGLQATPALDAPNTEDESLESRALCCDR